MVSGRKGFKMFKVAWSGNSKVACPAFDRVCYRWSKGTQCKGCYAYRLRGLATNQFHNEAQLGKVRLAIFVAWMIAQVGAWFLAHRKAERVFRIHGSGGEFDRPVYLKAWVMIAKALPMVQFYSYSKEAWIQGHDLPDNLRIRVNAGLNYGSLEWCERKAREDAQYFICPCGRPGIDIKKICGKRCRECADRPAGQLPLFIYHGPDAGLVNIK